jgi:hypothetical protein
VLRPQFFFLAETPCWQACQELIHRLIYWLNRLQSLKILAFGEKMRTIRRPCGLTAGIFISIKPERLI